MEGPSHRRTNAPRHPPPLGAHRARQAQALPPSSAHPEQTWSSSSRAQALPTAGAGSPPAPNPLGDPRAEAARAGSAGWQPAAQGRGRQRGTAPPRTHWRPKTKAQLFRNSRLPRRDLRFAFWPLFFPSDWRGASWGKHPRAAPEFLLFLLLSTRRQTACGGRIHFPQLLEDPQPGSSSSSSSGIRSFSRGR